MGSSLKPKPSHSPRTFNGGMADDQTYRHYRSLQTKAVNKDSVLPGVHLVASSVKRVIIGAHQGRFGPQYLQNYLDEYVFRLNRRTSRSVGEKFMRIVRQVVHSSKITYYEARLPPLLFQFCYYIGCLFALSILQ